MLRAVAFGLLLASCGGPSPTPQPRPPTSPERPDRETVTAPAQALPSDPRNAIRSMDPNSGRSVQAAMEAIQNAGQTKNASMLEDIAVLLAKPPDHRFFSAQIAAAIAVAELGADPKAAVAALVPAINRRFAKVALDNADELSMQLALAGAAVNSLAKVAHPSAIDPILMLMYRAPQLSMQTRRALVACGPNTVDAVRKVLRGSSPVDAVIKSEQLDQACEPDGTCTKTSIRDFYAASVAGDLGDPLLAVELWKVIEQPSLPAWIVDAGAGPTQHAAAFDALRKLGATSVAPKVLAMIRDPKASIEDRTLAASVYAYVVAEGKAIDPLGQIAADNNAEDGLRQATADSYARLGTEAAQLALMDMLAKKYLDASAQREKEALTQTDDGSKKRIFRIATAYLGYARMFQNHMARIAIAIVCRTDVACYVDTLSRNRDDAAVRMKRYIRDTDTWTDAHKQDMHDAMIDRSMLEISKRGTMSPAVLDKLLDHVGAESRLVRQSILLALSKAAPRPCPACIIRLDVVIEQDRGKATLGDLTVETTIVRNFLRWTK